MYKKTQPSPGDLFTALSNQVTGRKLKILENPTCGHNIFYDQITRQIDEDISSVLCEGNNGQLNASVYRTVAMMILKEIDGWSVEQLFEQAYIIECTPQMQSRHIKHVTTDGGCDSLENRLASTQEDAPYWNLCKTIGRQSAIRFDRTEEGHNTAHNCQTGEVYTITCSKRSQKYRVQQNNKPSRYYTEEQIEQILLRQQLLSQQRTEDRTIRPNVESSIHQVFHRLQKNEKVKYRGKYLSHCYVLYRVNWVNFRRFHQNEAKNSLISVLLNLWRSVKVLAMNLLDCQRTIFEIKNYSYLPSLEG